MSSSKPVVLPTFAQLDSALATWGGNSRETGLRLPDLGSCWSAHLGDGVHVCGTRFARHLFLHSVGTGLNSSGTLCRVSRLPRGDSLYALPGLPSGFPQVPGGPPPWKQAAELLGLKTPPHGVTADGLAWYRVPPGGTPVVSAFSSPVMPYDWETLPNATRPTLQTWLADGVDASAGRFRRLVESFPKVLRQRLAVGPPAEVQLLWRRPGRSRGRRVPDPELSLHVVVPPTVLDASLRLIVSLKPHDRESRARFGIDAAYANENAQVTAREEGGGETSGRYGLMMHGQTMPGRAMPGDALHWKSPADALEGIAEWVLGNLPIPGPG